MTSRKRIGITMGDPAGVGPEILVKALTASGEGGPVRNCEIVVIGDRAVIDREVKKQASHITFRDFDRVGEDGYGFADIGGPAGGPINVGEISAEAGRLSYLAIKQGVELANANRIDALVTCPVSKEAINLAGIPFIGHTETLAEMTGTSGTVMMLAHGNVRVTHLTTHIPLMKVSAYLTPERLRRVIDLTVAALRDMDISRPRVAVAGLNPHAGENGLFGTEDTDVSASVIAEYADADVEVSGPHPGDTIFVRAAAGFFDAVIAMYHDQGHIPVKLLGFKVDPESGRWTGMSGVNITLGLPIIRTSVDHGTAFDIAGRGIANAQSLVEAIGYASSMAAKRSSLRNVDA